jgi:hypothetical protein
LIRPGNMIKSGQFDFRRHLDGFPLGLHCNRGESVFAMTSGIRTKCLNFQEFPRAQRQQFGARLRDMDSIFQFHR